jgi:hypothetical protein
VSRTRAEFNDTPENNIARLPIARKLGLIITETSVLALLLMSAVVIVNELVTYRSLKQAELSTLGDVIGPTEGSYPPDGMLPPLC